MGASPSVVANLPLRLRGGTTQSTPLCPLPSFDPLPRLARS